MVVCTPAKAMHCVIIIIIIIIIIIKNTLVVVYTFIITIHGVRKEKKREKNIISLEVEIILEKF